MGSSESGRGSQGHPVCVSSRDLVTLSPLADVSGGALRHSKAGQGKAGV